MKTSTETKTGTRWAITVFLIIAALCALMYFTGCTSKSGHLTEMQEIVVILDSTPSGINASTNYKIKRSDGTVAWYSSYLPFEKGDSVTVFTHVIKLQ